MTTTLYRPIQLPTRVNFRCLTELINDLVEIEPLSPAMATIFQQLDQHLLPLIEAAADVISQLPKEAQADALVDLAGGKAALLLETHPALVQRLLTLARSFADPADRTTGLIGLVLRLPAAEQPALLQEAIDAIQAIDYEFERSWQLRTLAVVLPDDDDEENPLRMAAIALAEALCDDELRYEALRALSAGPLV